MIASLEEANQTLRLLAKAEREKRAIEDEVNREIDQLKKRANSRAQSAADAILALRGELEAYVRGHRRTLFVGAARTVKLTFGVLRLKKRPPKIVFERGFDEDSVVAAIRRLILDAPRYIKSVDVVRKEQLKALDELTLANIGCRLVAGEDILIEPDVTVIEPGEKEVA